MLFMLNLYIVIYLIILLCLYYLIKKTFDNKITLNSLPHMVLYIIKFSKLKNVYYGLVLALTGIPPFLLFFIKFNYLIETLGIYGFGFFYIIFLIFFLNMIFYLQTLYLKDTNLNLEYLIIKRQKIKFIEVFIINYLLSIFYLSVFVLPDIILLSNLIVL